MNTRHILLAALLLPASVVLCAESNTATVIERVMKIADKDKDGKLDAKEYRKVSRMGGHAEPHFRGTDTDKDGFLNLAEFTAHAEAKLNSVANPKKRKK